SGKSATLGLNQLGDHFGEGFAFPIEVLVPFTQPLLVGNGSSATEFTDLGALTSLYAGTPGVRSVTSPVGPAGAPLGSWLNYSDSPAAVRAELGGILAQFLGADGRSVLLSVIPAASGLSANAVALLGTLGSESSSFDAAHPAMGAPYFAGGAPVTRDLAEQTALATERMALVVTIGLLVVLLFALRSWVIPLLAVATIGLSIGWAWGLTRLVLLGFLGQPLFFFVPTILFIIILGLGIDYNIFLLTRIREERLKGHGASESIVQSLAATGGIITAAAVILASAFLALSVGQFLLLRAIGFAVATAVLLDAMVVRTYLVPAALQAFGERAWAMNPFRREPVRGEIPSEETLAPTRP
ncbi:MAG: MMPL family transporter, partial [Thermoplasmata archaeon]